MPNDVIPKDLMNNVMGKIYDVIVNGDGTVVPKSQDNFFAWSTPGVPFEESDFDFLTQGLTGVYKPKMVKNADGTETTEVLTDEQRENAIATDTNQMYQIAESFARYVDVIPDASGIDDTNVRMNVKNDEGTLSDVYEETLQFSQVANTELSAADKKKIEKYRELLQVERERENLVTGEMEKVLEDTPLVKAYISKMQAYEDACLQYNAARIDALAATNSRAVHNFAINAPILRNKVKFAYNDWITNGYKKEYEGIAARIDQMTSRDLSLLKAQYVEALNKSKLAGIVSGADFYYTSLAPSNFAKSKGWTRFSFSQYDQSYYSKENKNKWNAAGGLSLGLFTIGGQAGGERRELNTKLDTSSFSFTFEICQVPIIRPWLKLNFLTSKTWRFAADNVDLKGKYLSDGKKPPHVDSMMPAIPTSMLFIRNLRLNFANSSDIAKEIDSKISGGGMVGYGPFFIGGSYGHESQERKRDYHRDAQGISVDGLQCIGFKCHLLPKAPNPDPSIKKWV